MGNRKISIKFTFNLQGSKWDTGNICITSGENIYRVMINWPEKQEIALNAKQINLSDYILQKIKKIKIEQTQTKMDMWSKVFNADETTIYLFVEGNLQGLDFKSIFV